MAAAHPDPGSAAAAARPRSDLRQLALIVAVEFVVNCGFGVIYPYLPLFLKDETGAHVWMIGVIAGATFVGTFLFSSPLGRLSDTLGRKPVIVAGAALFSLAMFLFATTTDPWWFVAFRFLEGVGIAASLPAGNAFVADVTADHQRSRAFGWLTTAQFGGLILGPAIGVGLYSLGGGERAGYLAIFLTGGCLTAAMAVVLAVFLREPARAPARAGDGDRREKSPGVRRLVTPPIFAFLVIAGSASLAWGGFEVVWSLWLQHLGASMAYISATWIVFSAPMLLSFVGGWVADRGNRFLLMFVGYAIAGVIWIVYGATRDLTVFLIANALEGLAIAFAYPAREAFLVQVSPKRWIGSVQGIEQTTLQGAALVGTLLAPLLYEYMGGYVISAGGVMALGGLALAAPVLSREWKRLQAEGEAASTGEASDAEAPADAPEE